MAKIDTQFMTKTAKKPYPLGPHMGPHWEVLRYQISPAQSLNGTLYRNDL